MAEKKVKYSLSKEGEFVIENYNLAKPFANFFPGIAGKYGIPMWVFYVNRAQGIISCGTKSKNQSILEFFPANKAWQLASSHGFRTFIKIKTGPKVVFYEPFQNGFVNLNFKLVNRMSVSAAELSLEEENFSLGLRTKVDYFTIPQENYAALARIVTLENTGKICREIELLDGLPQIIPFGASNLFLKKLGRTVEAWMNVENLEKKVPFYKLAVDPTDRPEVYHIKEGNFYLGLSEEKGQPKIISPIVDPACIFDRATDFSCPHKFLVAKKVFSPNEQFTQSKTPCGFLPMAFSLSPKERKIFYSLLGYMSSCEVLNASVPKIIQPGYLARKKEENKKIIRELEQDIDTQSSSPPFNLYARQTYLDNIIRGGYPLVFKPDTVFYLYSRKHGDLERDYNKFQLEPTYFSQGNGNYRDRNQNHRSDIWFNPQIKDENVVNFFNLLQTDGFNPLIIKGASFSLKDEAGLSALLKNLTPEKNIAKIITYLKHPFRPGELILFIEENKIELKVSGDDFLSLVLEHALKHLEAEHGEGFWTDHWTYNLDLLESYLGVYPEKFKEILFKKKVFTFFDNTEVVRPRAQKYVLKDGKVRQHHALLADSGKRELIKKRGYLPHLVRQDYGKGEIYQTTLIAKLLCLVANKLASLDPAGSGIEMEADKPNWYDALNGLPALFGSSVNETFELKRLLLFLQSALKTNNGENISLSNEIYEFLNDLDKLIQEYLESDFADKDYLYWDKSYSLKELYRQKTKFGLSGQEKNITSGELTPILERALEKIEIALSKSFDRTKGLYVGYFYYDVAEYESLGSGFCRPKKFIQKKLPLFLETQMHALRLCESQEKAQALYQAVRKSVLFDKKLKMYKVTGSLTAMPEEIGRCRVFASGWLEHESIWLHMEYKFLLELLKAGLVEEFYKNFKPVLVCFQPAQRYGRSILENSSFLVSSAFADKKLWGNGFVARLSGSTAEFLEIWLRMNLGPQPFFLNTKGELNLRFQPQLVGWLFNRQGDYAFNFLKTIRVTYHNPKRKDTFGKSSARIKKICFVDKNGQAVEIHSAVIGTPYAQEIRSCHIAKIEIYLD